MLKINNKSCLDLKLNVDEKKISFKLVVFPHLTSNIQPFSLPSLLNIKLKIFFNPSCLHQRITIFSLDKTLFGVETAQAVHGVGSTWLGEQTSPDCQRCFVDLFLCSAADYSLAQCRQSVRSVQYYGLQLSGWGRLWVI